MERFRSGTGRPAVTLPRPACGVPVSVDSVGAVCHGAAYTGLGSGPAEFLLPGFPDLAERAGRWAVFGRTVASPAARGGKVRAGALCLALCCHPRDAVVQDGKWGNGPSRSSRGGKFFYERAAECVEIVGLTAGDEGCRGRAAYPDLLVDPGASCVADVGRQAGP